MIKSPGVKKTRKSLHGRETLQGKIEKEFLTEEKILQRKTIDDPDLYLDFSDSMVIVLGRNQTVLKINRKGCEILGYPENKILGKNYFDNFIPQRFRSEMKEFFNDLISGKKMLRKYFENPVITRKGEKLIAWRNAILKDTDGNIIGTISEGRDITQQRQKERNLIESEKRFRLLFETAPAGYVSCYPDGRIQDANQYFTTLTGFKKEELINKNIRTIVFPGDKRNFMRFLDTLKRTIDLNVSELKLIRKDGAIIDVCCMARSTERDGKMVQIILYDISHRRMMDVFQDTQEKLHAIVNRANTSLEILRHVPGIIKRMLEFENVLIYLIDRQAEQPIKSHCLRHILHYLKGRKTLSETLTSYGSLISKFTVNKKEKFFACIPLKEKNKLAGILYCEDYAGYKFGKEKIRFLENAGEIIINGIARCRSFEQIVTANTNLNTFLNSTDEMTFIKDSQFRYLYVNNLYAKFFNKNPQDILGKTDFDLMDRKTARQCRATDIQALKENKLVVNEETAGDRVYETRKFPVKLQNGKKGVGAFIRDITEEKENKQKIENLMWMYSVLYQVNQAIVRAQSTEQLFRDVCEIAVNDGNFALAWVGLADYERKRVVAVAGSKKSKGYYKNIKISLDPSLPEGKGPTARAIRTGRICICHDILSDERMKMWQKSAKRYGFCSSASIPIKVKGKITGALNLYSRQRMFFTEEIKNLIEEIGSDIGICIEKLDAEELRRTAEKQLRESQKHLQAIFDNSPVPMAELDFSDAEDIMKVIKHSGKNLKNYLELNKDTLQSIRRSIKFLNINRKMFDLFNTSDAGSLMETFTDMLITPETIELIYSEKEIVQYEAKITLQNNLEKNVVMSLALISGEEKRISKAIVSVIDITDRVYMEKNIHSLLARFRGFFDTSTAGMGILDLEGKPVALNKRICEMLGYSHNELMEMKLLDVVHPEEIESVKSTFEKLQKSELTHYEGERRYIRKDGSVIWAYVSSELVFDQILNKKCITTIAIDITEQKRYLGKLERIQNILRVYAMCNETFAKAASEKAMLFAVCKQLTKSALGFSFIVLKNPDGFEIASYPDEGFEFLFELKELFVEKPQICPTTQGLLEKRQIILSDIENSNYPEEWKNIVRKYGYNSVFVSPVVVEENSIGCLSIFSPEKNRFIDDEENAVINAISDNLGYCITMLRAKKERDTSLSQLEKSYEQLQKAIEGISLSIAKIIEMRDPYTAGHQVRVAKLAIAIAKELNLAENSLHGLYFAGILHDIGKINVPVEILVKPTRLTEDEFNIIKLHSTYGYEILSRIPFPWNVAEIVLQHHERLNGTGYPDGKTEKEILQESKILAVADVVEAMAFDRPYRTGFGIDYALAEIQDKKGILFDPEAVDVCIRLFREKRFVFE